MGSKKKGDYEQDSVRTGCVWTTSLTSGMIWQARAAEVSHLYLSRTCDVVSQVCMQIGEILDRQIVRLQQEMDFAQ